MLKKSLRIDTIRHMGTSLFTIQGTSISMMNILTCLFVFILFFVVAKGIKTAVTRTALLKEAVSGTTLYSIGSLSYYAILLTGIYVSLTTVGINLTGVAVVIGALGVGVGFGLQSIFNNFVAGIILLIEKRVCVNDYVRLDSGDLGVVTEINVRSTTICTFGNRAIIVPNTEIVSKKLSRWQWKGGYLLRLRLPFSVERQVNKEEVKRVVIEAMSAMSTTFQDIAPGLWLTKISGHLQEFEAVVWTFSQELKQSSQSISASYLWALEDALTESGIKLVEAGCASSVEPSPVQGS